MRIGINLYSKWPYEQVIEAFLENGIDRTFVCIDHPQFDGHTVLLFNSSNCHHSVLDFGTSLKDPCFCFTSVGYSGDCCFSDHNPDTAVTAVIR
jgi:hypothetical protein